MAEGWFARNFVWRSSKDSIETGKVSMLACAEALFSVVTYWWIARHFHNYAHLLISILVAPLVLLRSDRSVAAGIGMFINYADNLEPNLRPSKSQVIGIILSIAICTSIFFILSADAYTWHEYLSALAVALLFLSFFSTAVGSMIVAMLAALAYALTAFSTAMFGDSSSPTSAVIFAAQVALTAVGFVGAGFVARIVLIRMFASIRYFSDGILQIPRNWWRTVFLTDIFVAPELVPDIEAVRQDYSFWEMPYKLVGDSPPQGDIFAKGIFGLSLVFGMIVIFIPAILYRYSIKSTCWLYLPLIYLVNIPANLKTAEGRRMFLRVAPTTRVEWARFVMAAVSLAVAAFALVNTEALGNLLQAANQGTVPITPVSLLFVLDFSGMHPWQVFTLPTAVLTLILFFWLDRLRREEQVAGNLNLFGHEVSAAIAAFRLRGLLAIVWLCVSVYYTASYLHSACRLPPWMNRPLEWHFPPPVC